MTVICVQDGQMAADSLACMGDAKVGSCQKWHKVKKRHGGGYIGFAGDFGDAYNQAKKFSETGEMEGGKDCTYLHLKADGTLWKSDGGGSWFPVTAPFVAIGSGRDIAMGAMAAGATAMEAAEIACEFSVGCGGPVHVLRVLP